MNLIADPAHWIVVGVTLVSVCLCVALHYEVLSGCSRFLSSGIRTHRWETIVLILVILTTHVAEIWIFAFGYFFLDGSESFGRLVGVELTTLPDYVYYSSMVYTTVGFGDIFPTGAVRFMSGMEALTGLVMITWSASFTFLIMQRFWKSK